MKFDTKTFMMHLLSLLLIALSAFCEIRTIHSLDELIIEEFSEKTLVLFDIDDVLIYPKDALLQNWRDEWKPEGMRAWTPEEDSIAWMNAKFQILEARGPGLLDLLHQKGIPTIGFTAFALDTKPSESIPKWRSQHLKELGLHFRLEKEVRFSFPSAFPPSFEEGVLYCGDFYKNDKNNKGKILALYLDWLDWTPEQIADAVAFLVSDDGNSLREPVLKLYGNA